MNRSFLHLAGCIVLAASHLVPSHAAQLDAQVDAGFRPLFDGRTLAGWETPEARYWTVEDGAITGRITPDQPCTTNQYLVWTGGELADFELKLKSRLNGQGGINNGFQFRSRLLPDHDVCGYQVDNNLQTPWLVRLYDEFGRHTLAMRGEHAIIDALGKRNVIPLVEASGPAWFKLEDWHEYHLVCLGTYLALSIDGRLAAQVNDHDPRRAETQGILALQLHSGPPTVVQFKDIRLKVLKPAAPVPPPAATRPQHDLLRRDAVAWWSLDTGGHGATPPLRHIPGWDRFELNVLPAGKGARPDSRIVTLDGAHFETESTFPLTSGPFTLFLRAFDPRGRWNATLAAKTGNPGAGGFRLFGEDLPDSAGPDLVFELGSPEKRVRVQVPWMPIDPTAWHDIVARYDGQALALFVDGERRASVDGAGPWNSAGTPLFLAAERQGDQVVRHFHGELETVAAWARALTDDEIEALSQSDVGHR